ncbi:MAG: hypothetical protein JNL82_29825 [Myxococcales bacterium]|nr:hypothetical protein [Myxococcales bacterium]
MTWPFLPTTGAFAAWPHDPAAAGRKQGALRRLRILQEDFRADIVQRIHETHMEPSVRNRIAKFVSVALSPARDVTRAVACAYDLGVRRVLRGASEEAQLAFASLVRESQAATKAPTWNAFAFFLGPTIVVPAVRKGRLALELLRPESTDVLADPEDPMGTPAAAAWAAHGGGADFVVLDAASWRYLSDAGKDVKTPQGHGLGYFPGAVFRLDEPIDAWWPRNYQDRLVDATITVATTYAKMQWVRKTQNRKLLSVIGDTEGIPRGQMIDPELAFTIETKIPNATQVQVYDFNTSPSGFLEEIRYTYENVIESYGIPQSAVTFNVAEDGGGEAVRIQKDKLGHLRQAQIPYLSRGETDLWPNAVAIARVAGHPLAAKLPPPDEIREMLDVQWPAMRTIDDPIQREALYKERLKRGGVSPLDMIQEDHPELTRDECRALLAANVEDYAWLVDSITSRGLAMDLASGLVASSQALGAMGPIVRDAARG